MSVRKKGRRKLIYDNKEYAWYIELDHDSSYYILNIISQDKHLFITCPLRMKIPYIISKGSMFQNHKTDGLWKRYRLPFNVPDIITPKFVSELISWAIKGSDALPLNMDLCGDDKMFKNIKWLFFDVGSTIMNEQAAYEHRMREIAGLAGTSFEKVYEMALKYYKCNKKGDLESAKALGVEVPKWHKEDEVLFDDVIQCFEVLSKKYKMGIIANQSLGTEERLERHGILKYIDLVIASAEEGVAKPNRRIFEIAIERSGCEPENAIMTGDRIDNDIVPANLMGMNTIWIRRGFGKYWTIGQEIEKPDFVVNSLMEICDILEGNITVI